MINLTLQPLNNFIKSFSQHYILQVFCLVHKQFLIGYFIIQSIDLRSFECTSTSLQQKCGPIFALVWQKWQDGRQANPD